jgi:hypothetical protein
MHFQFVTYLSIPDVPFPVLLSTLITYRLSSHARLEALVIQIKLN